MTNAELRLAINETLASITNAHKTTERHADLMQHLRGLLAEELARAGSVTERIDDQPASKEE